MTAGTREVHDHFEDHAADYVDHVAPRFAVTYDHVATVIAARRPGAVADVCCGDGRLAASTPTDRYFVGVDRSRALLGRARTGNPERVWIHGDALTLPLRGRMFDVVVCNLALLLTGDPSAALRQLMRVAAPGGEVLVSALRDIRPSDDALRPLRPSRLLALLDGAGAPVRSRHTLRSREIFDGPADVTAMIAGEIGGSRPSHPPASSSGDRVDLELVFDMCHLTVDRQST